MKTKDFKYDLPKNLIAQEPWPDRDQCKMLALDKLNGNIEDKLFFHIEDYLCPGDLLIVNETRVLPARLLGKKRDTGGNAELLLLKKIKTVNNKEEIWEALVKPGKRLKPVSLANSLKTTMSKSSGKTGPIVDFYSHDNTVILSAEIIDWASNDQPGMRTICLTSSSFSVNDALHKIGNTPLPPYIHNYKGNMEMYQTVYSANESSAAAPTAGLHFTNKLIDKLKSKGINFANLELEVGIDTFRPVSVEDPKDHKIHTELYSISQNTIDAINRCKSEGHKVVAVGTTSVRSLESAFNKDLSCLEPCNRKATSLFILPGYKFNVVDAMITNFHVPESTLMMLVSAFAGYDNIMNAYKHAVNENYRFLSFGDAMFIR